MVNMEELVVGLELKLAVAPLGNPLTFKFTLPVNPFKDVMLTV